MNELINPYMPKKVNQNDNTSLKVLIENLKTKLHYSISKISANPLEGGFSSPKYEIICFVMQNRIF